MNEVAKKRALIRARSRARRLAMQALYQWHLNPETASRLEKEFRERKEYADADAKYFSHLLKHAVNDMALNTDCIGQYADRPEDQIDPLERAVMMVALTEFRHRVDVPYKVVINEAVELAQRFGATESHKYVNAVLDRAAAELRSAEIRT